MNINLDEMDKAYILYDFEANTYGIVGELPEYRELTAGSDDQTLAVCDISHWTQADLDEFDSLEAGDRAGIIENLEFGVFANEMREHGSGAGIVFGMGGRK